MQDLEILYIQANLIWENPAENRMRLEQMIKQQEKKFDLVVLPETFTTGFPVDPEPFAETIDGETIGWMKALSATTGAVVTGSFLIKEEKQYTNTLIWMRPDNTFERYDKRHVFSMGGEHHRITAGKRSLITTLKGWKIKPMICYDLRFPVWSKNQYRQNHFAYDLSIYTANWPAVRAYPWDILLKARAIENQAYVLGVNRVGTDGLGNSYAGHSKVVDAKGNILSEAPENQEAIMHVTLSAQDLTAFREKFNVGRDWDHFTINT